MGRYDDRDLFKQLKNEKPLIKQMGNTAPPGITVKKMDMQRPERQRQVELLNTRPADEAQKPAAAKARFKDFGAPVKRPPQETKAELDLMAERPAERPARTPAAKAQPQTPAYEPKPRPERQRPPVRMETPAPMPTAKARYEIESAYEKKPKAYRHELKYYINPRDYEVLKSAMSSLLQMDENAVDGGYHIRSLYFDDWDDSALQEKLYGVKVRKKYRIRFYHMDDTGIIRLERKLKDGEYVSKDSMRLSKQEVERILDRDYAFLLQKKNPLAHDFFVELHTRGFKPVVIVDYFREAFVHRIEDVRITFDSDLRSGVFHKDIFNKDLQTLPMYEDELIVMEVKFNRYLPQYIRVILNNAESVSRSAVSKYVICRKYT